MEFSLPQKIVAMIAILNDYGYSAHVVGGCVRDMLLGYEPKDWDITTNALPEEVKKIFPRTYDTGLKHGTITVLHEGMLAEITTWRRDVHYTDHRHPDCVQFSQDLTEDLKRRDFTMNAMAYHPHQGLTDPFDGVSDIKAGLIRCVGNPMERFSEDALRMLRAIRFSAQLGFAIAPDTLNAIKKLSDDLRYVSRERVSAELNKMLVSQHPDKLSLLWETGLGQGIFDGIETLPARFIEACRALISMDKENKPDHSHQRKVQLLGLLFFLAFKAKPEQHAQKLMRNLKYDNTTLNGVQKLLMALYELKAISPRNVRRICRVYGKETARNAFIIHSALYPDKAASLRVLDQIDTPVLALTGEALLKTGAFMGPQIGRTLELLNFCIWERPDINDEETLLLLAHCLKDVKNINGLTSLAYTPDKNVT